MKQLLIGICMLFFSLAWLSCGPSGQPADIRDRPSLLLQSAPSLRGISFRPPARVSDIKGYGWEKRTAFQPDSLWLLLNEHSPVVTVAPGKVEYADNQGVHPGEYLVSILHAAGVRSTISGLHVLDVNEGDQLKTDAVIGKATGIVRVQLSILEPVTDLLPSRAYEGACARQPVWTPVFTAPYILGKGDAHAR